MRFSPLKMSIVLILSAGSIIRGGTTYAGITYTDLYTLGTPVTIQGGAYPNRNTGGQVVGVAGNIFGANAHFHAFLWSATSTNGVDLNALGFADSYASSASGQQQVGRALNYVDGGNVPNHAMLWSGDAASVIDLHPSGLLTSAAFGVAGGQQVGSAGNDLGSTRRAILWRGSAASAIDLTPAGVDSAMANNTDGIHQVGVALNSKSNSYSHALLWSGTANSAVDLHPQGFATSAANGVGGGQQVGAGAKTIDDFYAGNYHALVWNGTAASEVDLSSAGFTATFANDTNGHWQVGVGYSGPDGIDGPGRALLWSGTASSLIDLQSTLPASFVSSQADTIVGDTVYGLATDASGSVHAVSWNVPEPSGVGLSVMGVHWRGKDAIVKAHAAFHEIMFKDCKTHTDEISVRMLGADYGIVVWVCTVDSFTTPSGTILPKHQNRMTLVVGKNQKMHWQVVHGQNTPIDPEAARFDPVNKR